MSAICADHQHKVCPSHQLLSSVSASSSPFSSKKPFKDLEIPPRKLLVSKKSHHYQEPSPTDIIMSSFEANLHKYLPCNDHNDTTKLIPDDDDDLDPYSADHFRMYEFKVRRCTRSRSHDWTDCPFAHPGEKARRRDPRRFHYSGTVCPEFRRGGCSRGDNCEFAHGVFECWLHPSRYRTEACKDGKNCKRKVCFFAHSPRQLRILPEISCGERKYEKGFGGSSPCSCCLACHSMTNSPTSTLLGMSQLSPPLSPSLSPPLSPVKPWQVSGFAPVSLYGDRLSKIRSGAMSYKEVLTELMTSLEAMNFSEGSPTNTSRNVSIPHPWIDVPNFSNGGGGMEDQQPQFILSPSTPSPSSGTSNFFNGDGNQYDSTKGFVDDHDDHKIISVNHKNNGGGLAASSDPDLGWVNDLLM